MILGIDTSNYTTSVALYDGKTIVMQKQLLEVEGRGLRQSDALFAHTKQLPILMEKLFEKPQKLDAVCVSATPRNVQGSYMPCFLAGILSATSISLASNIPLYKTAHQDGHIVAALYSANRLDLIGKEFIAFHISGGTTECLYVSKGNPISIDIIANTLDINAGQLIDRIGVKNGLAFPCGKALTEVALTCKEKITPKVTFKGDNVHFSGAENKANEYPFDKAARYVIEYVKTAIDQMTKNAIEKYGNLPLLYAGGVMSNIIIKEYIQNKYNGIFAEPIYSTDNAAGVAIIGDILNKQAIL
ncbi:MAG: peptidase M22 [Oscillospiraceae bacterium]